jgi:hypothetical protein
MVSGRLEKIWVNDGKGKAAGKKVYDIVVDGVRYGAGFFPPSASEGDQVVFDVQENGNFKNAKSIKKLSAAPSALEKEVFGPGPAPAKHDDEREKSIRLMNAGNIAGELLAAIVPRLPEESLLEENLLDRWKLLVDGILDRYNA